MNIFNKLFEETLAQSVAQPAVVKGFSTDLKDKIATLSVAVVLGIIGLSSSGLARADSTLNGTIAVGGLTSMLMDGNRIEGLPPECANINKTYNGGTIALGATLGAVAGNQIGGGRGNKLATIGLGLLGASAMAGKQARQAEVECARLIAANRQNATNYANNNQASMPTEPILYQTVNAQGQDVVVTISQSVGLNALQGYRNGAYNIESNPVIKNAVETSLVNLNNSYNQFDNAGKQYLDIVNGKTSAESRYATDINQTERNSGNSYNQLKQALDQYKKSYDTYALARSLATKNLDEAAGVDNINLTQYAPAIRLFTPPPSAQVAYTKAYQKAYVNGFAKGI